MEVVTDNRERDESGDVDEVKIIGKYKKGHQRPSITKVNSKKKRRKRRKYIQTQQILKEKNIYIDEETVQELKTLNSKMLKTIITIV